MKEREREKEMKTGTTMKKFVKFFSFTKQKSFQKKFQERKLKKSTEIKFPCNRIDTK